MNHLALFNGIGGFQLAAHWAGWNNVAHVEIDEWCNEKVLKNFPNSKCFTDVRNFRKENLSTKIDVITGGFPCQDISIANVSNKKLFKNGKSIGIKGERSSLWTEMWRIIGEFRPSYAIIENSPMLIVRGLNTVLCDLAKIGYVLEWQCLSASQFGYNHKRERFYGIAYPIEKRCKDNTQAFLELSKVLLKKPPRQNPVPMPFKRFNGSSDYEAVRMYDGFSAEMDNRVIEALGNAVIPEIAYYLFECVKNHQRHSTPSGVQYF